MSQTLPDTSEFDLSIQGERKSVEIPDVEVGVSVDGTRLSVDVELERDVDEIYLVVTGDQTTVRVKGIDSTVNFYHTGERNTIVIDESLTLNSCVDSGSRTSVKRESFMTAEEIDEYWDSKSPTVDELIEVSRDEVLSELPLLGVELVSYQIPAEDSVDWCPSCGSDSEVIITHQTERVLSVFGLPVKLSDVSDYQECEHCVELNDLSLSEGERKRLLR